MRLLTLMPLVALLAACSSGSSATTATPASSLSVELADFMLDPSELTATGPTIALDVTNAGPTPHNFSVRGPDDEILAATSDLSRGESETLVVELTPGTYTIFCGLPGHESLGMRGELTVDRP